MVRGTLGTCLCAVSAPMLPAQRARVEGLSPLGLVEHQV